MTRKEGRFKKNQFYTLWESLKTERDLKTLEFTSLYPVVGIFMQVLWASRSTVSPGTIGRL